MPELIVDWPSPSRATSCQAPGCTVSRIPVRGCWSPEVSRTEVCQAVIAAEPEWLGANSTRAPIVRTSVFIHFSSQLAAFGASAGPWVISRSTTPSGQAS